MPQLRQWLGGDPAFIFVDPKGWKGAAMRFIAPLVTGGAHRDVLVNVMFDHINRFKDDSRSFLREQMRDFFGLKDADLPEGLEEEQLFGLYRSKLKEHCGIAYAADLAIPHPTVARTKFRLVVGGRSPDVLSLFRDIERNVIGSEAAGVRETAATRKREDQTGQLSLLVAPPATDAHYDSLHSRDMARAGPEVLSRLSTTATVEFSKLWPELLEELHVTRAELGRVVWELRRKGDVVVTNGKPRERTVGDRHLLLKT